MKLNKVIYDLKGIKYLLTDKNDFIKKCKVKRKKIIVANQGKYLIILNQFLAFIFIYIFNLESNCCYYAHDN